jgi:hypothetical protein
MDGCYVAIILVFLSIMISVSKCMFLKPKVYNMEFMWSRKWSCVELSGTI